MTRGDKNEHRNLEKIKNKKNPKIPLIIKTKTKYSINFQETEKFPKILKFRK
jgi:hypothetical protein